MNQALIRIRPRASDSDLLEEMGAAFIKAWNVGEPSSPTATFTFTSPAQLFSVISPKRWELIEHLQNIGASTIRGLAKSLGRDVRRVHDDVTVLIEWGIAERTKDDKVCIPYDVIHADFDLRAAA
jgi:predicted transcriptional regulator